MTSPEPGVRWGKVPLEAAKDRSLPKDSLELLGRALVLATSRG